MAVEEPSWSWIEGMVADSRVGQRDARETGQALLFLRDELSKQVNDLQNQIMNLDRQKSNRGHNHPGRSFRGDA